MFFLFCHDYLITIELLILTMIIIKAMRAFFLYPFFLGGEECVVGVNLHSIGHLVMQLEPCFRFHTVDASEIPRPTTWDVKNLVNNGRNYLSLNW